MSLATRLPDSTPPPPSDSDRFHTCGAIFQRFMADWAPTLHPQAVNVFLAVLSFADWSTGTGFPSFEAIAQRSGLSRRQVIRWLGPACPHDWQGERRRSWHLLRHLVNVEKRTYQTEAGTWHNTNVYRIPLQLPPHPDTSERTITAACSDLPAPTSDCRTPYRRTPLPFPINVIEPEPCQPEPEACADPVPQPSDRQQRVEAIAHRLLPFFGDNGRRRAFQVAYEVERRTPTKTGDPFSEYDVDAAIADTEAALAHESRTSRGKYLNILLMDLVPSLRSERFKARLEKASIQGVSAPQPRARSAPGADTFHYSPPITGANPGTSDYPCELCKGQPPELRYHGRCGRVRAPVAVEA